LLDVWCDCYLCKSFFFCGKQTTLYLHKQPCFLMSDNCIYGSFFLLDQFCTVNNGILRWKLEYTPFCSCIFHLSYIKYRGSYHFRHASMDLSRYTIYNSELNKAHTYTHTHTRWDADTSRCYMWGKLASVFHTKLQSLQLHFNITYTKAAQNILCVPQTSS